MRYEMFEFSKLSCLLLHVCILGTQLSLLPSMTSIRWEEANLNFHSTQYVNLLGTTAIYRHAAKIAESIANEQIKVIDI